MSIISLKKYIDTRDKYIHLFKELDREDIPKDVKNYILNFLDYNIEIYHTFDKDIDNIMKNTNKNYQLTIDSYHLLNYLIYLFIEKTIKDSVTVMEHSRRKTITSDDLDYSLGIYSINKYIK